jgi:hypothetical protein
MSRLAFNRAGNVAVNLNLRTTKTACSRLELTPDSRGRVRRLQIAVPFLSVDAAVYLGGEHARGEATSFMIHFPGECPLLPYVYS